MTLAKFDLRALNAVDKVIKAGVNSFTPFYRAHPYRGRLWITEVDMRVAVSREYRFLYNRLPKNANSTITSLLYSASFIEGEGPEKSAKHAFQRPAFLDSASVSDLPNYFKFCIVRDPYSRTLSAYLDKIVNKARPSKRPLRITTKRFGTRNPSFEQFCEYLAEGGLYDDNHWAPQLEGLVLAPSEFDHIGKFETLENELKLISERIFGRNFANKERSASKYTVFPPVTNASERLREHYTPRARDIVRELYEKDFDAFDYDRR